MRRKIYEIVHVYESSLWSRVYKYFMILTIAISLLPLAVKGSSETLFRVDVACLAVFLLDYLLRWITADYKFQKHHWSAFAKYPFRLISVIDLLSIIALVLSLSKAVQSQELISALKVFRVVRICRYSKSIRTILEILKKSRKPLMAVGSLAIGYIVVSALIVFNVEPDSFETFFDAIYWATVSLTTVGYGDIYPVTALGRTVAMVSSFFGIAIVALPAGIVTAEYLKSIQPENDGREKDEMSEMRK